MKHIFVVAAVIVALLIACGCQPTDPSRARNSSHITGPSLQEHLTAAMDYLERSNEFEEAQSSFQVAYHLNRWLEQQKVTNEWNPDPRVGRLPRDIRSSPELQQLDRLQFRSEDAKALQQAVWMRQVSHWAAQRPVSGISEDSFLAPSSSPGNSPATQLSTAYRLFDWTIRNIQLDALIPYPADVVAHPQPKPGESLAPLEPPPMRGIPGPGYQYHPWQTLLYGHGDAWQRARVFILLCRQQGIDAVMLAFPGQTTPPRPQPWLTAVLIQDQLHLFDTQLGLPVPGPGGRGVATLGQVLDDAQLLRGLDVDDEHRYPVQVSDLKSILALLDADADALSRRMKLVEEQLTGKYRTMLTTAPSSLAQQLEKIRGVAATAVWSIPFETTWYQAALAKKMQEAPLAFAKHFLEIAVFTTRNSLVEARHLHLRGILDNQGEITGAKSLYLEARIPKAQIDRIDTSEDVQKQLGLLQDRGERDFVWKNRLASSKIMLSQAKEHATFWLGLTQYETGRFDAAIEWLERRTLEAMPESRWKQAARYNLARSYEALGETDRARGVYLADDPSPQWHGNVLRSRLLKGRAAERATR